MNKRYAFWRNAAFVVLTTMLCCTEFLAHSANKPGLVNIKDTSPTIIVDIPYASKRNFTGIRLYTHNVCLLQPAVADAVKAANLEAISLGYRLKMLDCYRPKSVSLAMWQAGLDHNRACRNLGAVCKHGGCDPTHPDCLWEPLTNYVSRNSKHNRGAAVDLTLVTLIGGPIDMGTPFDHFGPEARTKNATGKALKNRMLLKRIMANHGFSNYFREWWHYNHNSYSRYGVMDVPLADYVNE